MDVSADQNSLLTDTQREFLRMSEAEREEEFTKQLRSYHKRNILKRLHVGLPDISLILEELPIEDLKEAVEYDSSFAAQEDTQSLSLSDLVTLAFVIESQLPYLETGAKSQQGRPERRAELMVRAGIMNALEMLGESWTDLSVVVDRGDPLEELAEQDLMTLSDDELDQLRSAGFISREEYAEAILGASE
ncbi:hypothetical protein C497_00220 [Halalkalicoccus jeotgali B3]|uniref:Uncharacterized protein n=2 Tax=Halalkalicoccus jeotgali TaxID=413810 RepID=D8JCR0_HALJB|nr:hypothetical protein HacjB3_17313 [Halalkalicoccus jeotgali B3]ADJ17199.1 hypothetical protein HacjB3_19313 [Halalkalicoccus jeotgali B3]ELY41667.1 hypothetical protein C497_00220 [Halalkalicoccus jeotgali B3]